MAQAEAHGKAERRRKGRSQCGWDEQRGRRSGAWTPAARKQPPWGRGGARLPLGAAGCWWRRRAGEGMDGAGGDAGVEPPELDKEEATTEMMGNERRKSSGGKELSPWEASGRA